MVLLSFFSSSFFLSYPHPPRWTPTDHTDPPNSSVSHTRTQKKYHTYLRRFTSCTLSSFPKINLFFLSLPSLVSRNNCKTSRWITLHVTRYSPIRSAQRLISQASKSYITHSLIFTPVVVLRSTSLQIKEELKLIYPPLILQPMNSYTKTLYS